MSGAYGRDRSNPQATPQEILDLYNRNIPNTLSATYGQSGNVAQQLSQAADVSAGGEASRLQQYAPGYQQLGIDTSTRQAGASADLLGGEGARTAFTADALNRSINPNYYKTSDQLSKANTDLLSSFGQGANLGGGELAAAERAINQGNTGTGNLGLNNQMNLIGNALNFGQYARQKQQMLGNAIGQVNATVPNMVNPTFNPVTTALGAGNTAGNFGLQQYNPVLAQEQAGAAGQFGQGVLGGAFGLGAAANKSSIEKSGGVNCCFIFLEAYNGRLPWFIRIGRDIAYHKYPKVASGYKNMAKWLVPLMQKYNFVRWLVNTTMVIPLTKHGAYVFRLEEGRKFKKYKFVQTFWFNIWKLLA